MDQSAIVIRRAKPSDIPSLSILLVQSFNPEIDDGLGRWLQPLLYLSIQADLQQRFRSQASHYICIVAVCAAEVGKKGGVVVGTVEMTRRSQYVWSSSPEYIYVSNLAVQSQYRRQGIAYRLLQECEGVAIQWGFSDVFLHVREDNEAARYLYKQVGYQIERIDFNLGTLILRQPRTLLLCKQLRMKG